MLSVGRVAELSNVTAATAPKAADKVTEEKTTTLASDHTDKFVKSETGYTPAYTKATVTDNRSGNATQDKAEDVAQKGMNVGYTAKSSRQLKNESMKSMVTQLLTGQASAATGNSNSIQSQLNEILSSFDIEPIEADSEDFWGAEKTAQRILDFAKGLGSDKESFAKLRDAFEKGFGESEKIWGGKLPDVCQETYDLVQKGFDEWEKELNGAIDEVAAEAKAAE